MSVYLDASVLVPTLVMEGSSPLAEAYLFAAREPFVVSEFAAAEVASALSRLVRMKLLVSATAESLLMEFDHWRSVATRDTEFQHADFRLANTYVQRFDLGLRAPDALHVAVCRRGGLQLVTLDARLAKAGNALGVRVHQLA